MGKNMQFRVLAIDIAKDWQSLIHSCLPYSFTSLRSKKTKNGIDFDDITSQPLKQILLLIKELGCKSIIIEDKYVDIDYRSEYSRIYCKMFRRYEGTCTRLHFFRNRFTSINDFIKEDKPEYLGFSILRPVDIGRVGRTVISSPFKNPNNDYVLCKSDFKTHVLGRELTVSGSPFIQQESMAMECARASVWTASYYMHNEFGHQRVLPGNLVENIEQLAGMSGGGSSGRIYPAEGLTPNQMLSMLGNIGFAPINLNKNEFTDYAWDPVSLAYPYIESQIPVILTMPQHAITCIGHTFEPNPQLPHIAKKPYVINSKFWVNGLIVQDDAAGPYRIMPTKKYSKKYVKLYKDHLPNNSANIYTTDDIDGIIIPLPEKIYLGGEHVFNNAFTLLDDKEFITTIKADTKNNKYALEFLNSLEDAKNPVVVRPYFCMAKSYKKYLTKLCADSKNISKQGLINKSIALEYAHLDMSKYIWVAELTTAARLSKSKEKERTIMGEIIYDSTSHRNDPFSWLAIHLPGVLYLQTDSTKRQFKKKVISEDVPYSHISRQTKDCKHILVDE